MCVLIEQDSAVFPVKDDKQSHYHTSEVGEMRHAFNGTGNAGEKLDYGKDGDHPFGAERDGREEQGHPGIGEQQSIS